ncbi:MAG: hypothetical protein GY946_01060 [bacterium]|nr:hypothetical protein [bacterium]
MTSNHDSREDGAAPHSSFKHTSPVVVDAEPSPSPSTDPADEPIRSNSFYPKDGGAPFKGGQGRPAPSLDSKPSAWVAFAFGAIGLAGIAIFYALRALVEWVALG